MKLKILSVLLLFLLILLPPLLMRPAGPMLPPDGMERLVIITPHNDSMKSEMESGFRKYYMRKFGKDIIIDYRAPGGTSDIVRFIADRYRIEFRDWCEKNNMPWTDEISGAFFEPSTDSDTKASEEAKKARKAFLSSGVGIGIDLMCGGGVFDMSRNAKRGFAVDAGIAEDAPELLSPAVIPHSFGGEVFYDSEGRYYGLCLSTFGICCNRDRLAELSDPSPPRRWKDLAQWRFYNNIIVADPTKSGSANKCFEIIIQQIMAEENSPVSGWKKGLNTLKRITANAAFVTDSAGKVTRDVASGCAAAGMAIDTYGMMEKEWNSIQFGGDPRFFYITPEGGTAVSTDPVQMLRGAPNGKAAREFIKFMLSPEGQKILCFKPGTPEGPEKHALRRPPVRKDMYAEEYRQYRSDPDYNPYESGASFVYHAAWTGRYYDLLRVLIKTLMLDCQDELKDAWRAINEAGGEAAVPEAAALFNALPFGYEAAGEAVKGLADSSGGALGMVRLKQKWRSEMRRNYIEAARMAREHRKTRGGAK